MDFQAVRPDAFRPFKSGASRMIISGQNQRSQVNPVNWRMYMKRPNTVEASGFFAAQESAADERHAWHLARAFTLAKTGKTVDAREELEAARGILAVPEVDSDRLQAEQILVDAHVRAYEDRSFSPGDAETLKWALDRCDSHDLIGQGLALNQLCILSIHLGNLDKAQEYGESASRLYRQGGAEFGSLHLLTHLGQIKLMRGDLEGASAEYSEMEKMLESEHGETAGLIAVCRALRSEVAYEMNDLAACRSLVDSAMESVEENDAWLDVRAAAYRVRIRLAYDRSGLPGAMTELAHSERIAQQRSMPRLLRLIQIERLRVLTLSDETAEALKIARAIGVDPTHFSWEGEDDWAFRRGSTVVAIARWMVRARRAPRCLVFLQTAEDVAIRGGQLLTLAKLRVIRAAAHWRLQQKTEATGALLSAVRLLGHQPFRRFILDEGEDILCIVLAILDGDHLSAPITPAQRKRLAEISHYSTVNQSEGRRALAVHPGDESIGNEAIGKYLELLALGLSNKEIGRTMGVSVNTVKYHLKAIFKDLRVTNRTQAVVEAGRLGMTSTHYPDG